MRKTYSVQAVQRKWRSGLRKIRMASTEAWGRVCARPKLFGGIAGGVVVAGCVAVATGFGIAACSGYPGPG